MKRFLVTILAILISVSVVRATWDEGFFTTWFSNGYCGTTTGTDVIACGTIPPLTSYESGQRFTFKAGGTNTGATTINIDGLGAKTVLRGNGVTALSAGDITAGYWYEIVYDGTNFILTDLVMTAQIAEQAVDSTAIATNAVGSSEIATDAVGSDEIAANAVGSSEIASLAVDTAELAADAVTGDKIEDNAVGAEHLDEADEYDMLWADQSKMAFISWTNDEDSTANASEYGVWADANYTGTYDYTETVTAQGIALTSTNGRITVTNAGTYVFTMNLVVIPGAAEESYDLRFVKNGITDIWDYTFSQGSAYDKSSHTIIFTLAASDFFTLQIDGSNTVQVATGSTFSMYRID